MKYAVHRTRITENLNGTDGNRTIRIQSSPVFVTGSTNVQLIDISQYTGNNTLTITTATSLIAVRIS